VAATVQKIAPAKSSNKTFTALSKLLSVVATSAPAQNCGSLSATSGDSVTYIPPSSGATTATITATVSANSSISQSFTVSVSAPGAQNYTVGGTVSGLGSGASVVLLDNGGDSLTVSSNGAFAFPTSLASGSDYQVLIATQPSGEICTLANNGPTVIAANVTNVAISCQTAASNTQAAQRALAQTGLGIGLTLDMAETTLVTTEGIVVSMEQLAGGGDTTTTGCQDGYEIGAASTTTLSVFGLSVPVYPVTIYYDEKCKNKKVDVSISAINFGASGTSDSASLALNISATNTFYDASGNTLGTLPVTEALTASIIDNGASFQISGNGTGTFTPTNPAASPVQLGLYCLGNISASDISSTNLSLNIPCGGGVAQNFPSLNLAIGSVTPISIQFDDTFADSSKNTSNKATLTFSGSSAVQTGSLNSLALTNPATSSLVLSGGSAFSAPVLSGGLQKDATSGDEVIAWTQTDTLNDMQLSMSIDPSLWDSATAQNTNLTITKISTGATLATGTVDAGGNGTITFSDGTTDNIVVWTISDTIKG
jgi:hypothetical protein